MRAGVWTASIVVGIVIALGLVGASQMVTTGSGYDQSYSRAAGSSSVAAVDLVSVSSNDPGGTNITVSFSVSGTVVLNSGDYLYYVYFGGTGSGNSSAWTIFSNNSTAGEYYGGGSNSFSFGTMGFTLTNGGSTLTFSIGKAVVGPATNFSVDAYAEYATNSQFSFTWLGTDYNSGTGSGSGGGTGGGGGGGGTCTASGCVGTSGGATNSNALWLYIGLGVVLVVVALVAVLLLLRRKKVAPTPSVPPPMGYYAPPPPGTSPAMPPPPNNYQSPPPPPPR